MIYQGDCRAVMRQLIEQGIRVQTCVTSPPYWGLRNYNCEGQLGLEETPEQYVANMVEVFGLVSQLLYDDGTLWLNLGDSYAGSGKGGQSEGKRSRNWQPEYANKGIVPCGVKPKDLVGIPWRVAFALQASGWYLRSDIIWSKPNPMPESVTDRPTKAHEYIFLFSKQQKYYYDAEAIKEPGITHENRPAGIVRDREYDYDSKEKILRPDKQRGHGRRHAGFNDRWDAMSKEEQCGVMRNKRTVWEVSPMPYAEAHFATFPPKLIEPCILAGSRTGDIVLDPFFGSGTTGEVAQRLGRKWIGCEINEAYAPLQEKRTAQSGLPL